MSKICYLCGKELTGKISRDHVPPRLFYPSEILKNKHDLNLLTYKVHTECNEKYKQDEEYFYMTLAPAANGSYVSQFLWKDIKKKTNLEKSKPLVIKIFNQFKKKIGSLYLPPDRIAIEFDGERIWRIIWKIIRGLFYYKFNQFLPEDIFKRFISIGYEIPNEFRSISNQPSQGIHKGIIDYKYLKISDANVNHYIWAMLFWDKLIVLTIFKIPNIKGQ